MPDVTLRRLPVAWLARARAHGAAVGVEDDAACIKALADYAMDQRDKRAAGGAARHASTTPEQRAEAARHAAKARWGKT